MATSPLEKLLAELRASPRDLGRLLELAQTYEHTGKPAAAARTYVVLADLWALDGDLVRSIALTKRAAQLMPGNVEALRKLVAWHEQLGLEEEAAEWRLRLPGG